MRLSSILAPLSLSLLATASLAVSRDETSWAKAGVPLEEYVRDAKECADTSRTVSVSIKPDTLRQLDALSSGALLDIAMQAAQSPDFNPMAFVEGPTSQKSADDIARRTNTFGAKYVAIVRPNVKDELQEVLDKCLHERGYVQIVLTTEQKIHLSRLKHLSGERTAYLHMIDSDPAVIARQRLTPAI
jgi:hypothetical protein